MKQVLDTTLPLRVVDGVVRQVARRPIAHPGLADCAALEVALAVRARVGGEIAAVSVGGGEAVEALRFALARGVDRAVHVERPDQLDAVGAAASAVRVLRQAQTDLVVTGAASGDGASGLFPAVAAEQLGWPLVTEVGAVAVDDVRQGDSGRWLTVERRLGRGDREIVRCPLRAVLATHGAGVEVPYLALRAVRRAACLPIEVVPGGEASIGAARLIALEPAKPRPRRVSAPAANLSAMDRVAHLLSGGMQPKRGGEFVEGHPQAVAAEIVRFLGEKGFIRVSRGSSRG